MTKVEFVQSLLGRPYKLGAQGPAAFDCWSLTRYVQEYLYNRSLEAVSVVDADAARIRWFMAAHKELGRWAKVSDPVDGSLVTMTLGVDRTHVGTFLDIDRGLVLHAAPECGVSLDSLSDLMGVGWARLQYWSPKCS